MGFLREHPDEELRGYYEKWASAGEANEDQLSILERELGLINDPGTVKLVLHLIDGLNANQMEAVLHNHSTDGPLLILAGAGSGKTATLTRRVVYLLLTGVSPENILCMTFTNKAAGEMKERVKLLIEELISISDTLRQHALSEISQAVGTMWISTFHSACLRFLREQAGAVTNLERMGIPPHVAILDPLKQKEILSEVFESEKLNEKDYPLEDILNHISNLKNELKDPELAASEAVTDGEMRKARIFKLYQEKLREKQVIDFDDMIYMAARVLTDFPDVLEHYRNLFQYCLIDEYQDTNLAQYVFTINLVEKHRKLFAVGDDDQSIYAWRGADIRNILNFKRDFPDCKIIRLEKNYRSTGNILFVANKIFADKPAEYRKVLKVTRTGSSPRDKYGERVIRVRTVDQREEAEFVAFEIDQIRKETGCRLQDCAVLYRVNVMREPLIEVFSEKGIPFIEMGNSEHLRQPQLIAFIDFLSIFSDFVPVLSEPLKTADSFRRELDAKIIAALELPVFRMEEEDRAVFTVPPINPATGQQYYTYELFMRPELYDTVLYRLSETGQNRYYNLYMLISELINSFNEYTLYGFIETVLERSGFRAEILSGGELEKMEKMIKRFLEMAGLFEQLLPQTTETWDRLRLFLLDLHEKLYGTQTEFSPVEDGVRLITLHSAKGLEFPNVFFIGLNDGICPLHHPSEKEIDREERQLRLDEEKRLFYVGVTRAMDRLYLISTFYRTWHGRDIEMKPSGFLDLLPKDIIEEYDQVKGVGGNLIEKSRRFFNRIFS